MKTKNGYRIHEIGGGYVVHFRAICQPDWSEGNGPQPVLDAVRKANNIAHDFGGRRYHNQSFGGGVLFTDLDDLEACIDFVMKGGESE